MIKLVASAIGVVLLLGSTVASAYDINNLPLGLSLANNRPIEESFYIRRCYVRVLNRYPFLSQEERHNVKEALWRTTIYGKRSQWETECQRLEANPYVGEQ